MCACACACTCARERECVCVCVCVRVCVCEYLCACARVDLQSSPHSINPSVGGRMKWRGISVRSI